MVRCEAASFVDSGGRSQILQMDRFQRFVILLDGEVLPIHISVATLGTEYGSQHLSFDVSIATFTARSDFDTNAIVK